MPVSAAAFRRRKLSLTSLIDVIFLLLLFFMLSSTFSRNGEIAFLADGAGSEGNAERPPLFLRLDDTSLSLNGVAIASDDLLAAIADRIGDNSPPRIIVSVTGGATSQALVDVLVSLARVPGAEITVVE
jgi:biopolymer transport protein ExbD